jgi:hypothetical protein
MELSEIYKNNVDKYDIELEHLDICKEYPYPTNIKRNILYCSTRIRIIGRM